MPEQEEMSRRRLLSAVPGVAAGVAAVLSLPAAADETKVLSPDELKTLLDNLGYEPEALKNVEGDPFYRIRLKQDTWTFVFDVSMSKNRTNVWVAVRLGIVPDPAKASPAPLLKMLAENDTLWPVYFSYTDSSKSIFLNVAMVNRDLTPAAVRKQVDALLPIIRRTQPLWDPKQWAAPEEKKV